MDNEPLLVIQPRFNAVEYFVRKYLLTLIVIIGLMIFTVSSNTEENLVFVPYFLIALALYLVYIFIRELMLARKYKLVQYLFFVDSLLVINRTRKGQDVVVAYNEIVDILMIQNFFKRMFNQGDLIVKLSEDRFFAKTLNLMGISNFDKRTKQIFDIIYGGNASAHSLETEN